MRTGMGARVHFVSILRITPRVVGGGCVRDVECILLFMMLQSTVSESSALESYDIFRASPLRPPKVAEGSIFWRSDANN